MVSRVQADTITENLNSKHKKVTNEDNTTGTTLNNWTFHNPTLDHCYDKMHNIKFQGKFPHN